MVLGDIGFCDVCDHVVGDYYEIETTHVYQNGRYHPVITICDDCLATLLKMVREKAEEDSEDAETNCL